MYIWQQEVMQNLTQRIVTNTLAHALLFVGAKGLGKADLAAYMHKMLLCHKLVESKESNAPCNSCKSCYLFASNNHPDHLSISAEGIITVDKIRELNDFLLHTSVYQHGRTVIIQEAHNMNQSAANALLKILEEPPVQTSIILITENSHQLPLTILSRCQKIEFKMPNRLLALEWLNSLSMDKKKQTFDWDKYLTLAYGAPLLAKELAQNKGCDAKEIIQDLLSCIDGQGNIVATAEKWSKQEAKEILTVLYNFSVDVAKIAAQQQNINNVKSKDLFYPWILDEFSQYNGLFKLMFAIKLNEFILNKNIEFKQHNALNVELFFTGLLACGKKELLHKI